MKDLRRFFIESHPSFIVLPDVLTNTRNKDEHDAEIELSTGQKIVVKMHDGNIAQLPPGVDVDIAKISAVNNIDQISEELTFLNKNQIQQLNPEDGVLFSCDGDAKRTAKVHDIFSDSIQIELNGNIVTIEFANMNDDGSVPYEIFIPGGSKKKFIIQLTQVI